MPSPAHLAERVRPISLAESQLLPVPPPLEVLLPKPGLGRGTVIAVNGTGATSLALALAAGPSSTGSWIAVVDFPELGLASAGEMGIELGRLAVIPRAAPEQWLAVLAALIGAFDVVLARPPKVAAGQARRLVSRVRERGTVLVLIDQRDERLRGWPEPPDICLEIQRSDWEGLGSGHGYLQARRVRVEATGRRGAARSRQAELWMPGADGRVSAAEPAPGVVVPIGA